MPEINEVSVRDVLVDAIGAAAADKAILALDQAGFAVAANVWVATLELSDDDGTWSGGWVSAHTTSDGAARELVRFARDSGISVPPYDPATGCDVLDNHPDVQSYGVSYLPVQR